MYAQDCPACSAEESVQQDGHLSETCTCEDCGARFEIDADADFNGDHFVDCSTVGKQIEGAS